MLLYTPSVCLQRCTSYSMYCQSKSSQLQGGFTQSMALWKHSHSQAVSCHAKSGLIVFSFKKNKSSDLQNAACFFSLGQRLHCRLSARDHMLNVKLDIPSHQKFPSISWNSKNMAQKIGGTATGSTATGLGLSFAVSGMANAEGPVDNNIDSTQTTESSSGSTHGKKVYTDYSVTGIPGDGRCLFRSVAHGACIRSGKPIPNEDLQRKLADDLRTMVADEFVKRRAETEWMPITVYMHDEEAGGLIAIAEYGQEYGKEDPIQVLYHGFGHYDGLQIPGKSGPRSRL